jgi:hypothetical protein
MCFHSLLQAHYQLRREDMGMKLRYSIAILDGGARKK